MDKLKKVKKRLARRIAGHEIMVKNSQTGGREYTKPGSEKK